MARYKVILAYDGTHFFGSQRQADIRTVQVVVETALRKLGWTEQAVLLSGRTDSGVHATGQVLAFRLAWNHSPDDLLRAMNALLPEDVAVQAAMEVHSDFHPRYDALSRRYRYQVLSDPVRQPLAERYAWRVWPAPDVEILRTAANLLVGVHDFAAFGSPHQAGGSTIRHLMAASWEQDESRLSFMVTGNAFLYHMVRRLVFIQVLVAQAKLEMAIIQKSLQFPGNRMLQGLAPPQGLTLVEIKYP